MIEGTFEWWLDKAQAGDAAAQCKVGEMYQYGDGGVEQNYEKAYEWHQKAANQGFVEAFRNLGLVYIAWYGDEHLAAHWWRRAAEAGDVNAQCNMGHVYNNGNVVPRDVGEAVKWWKMADSQGTVDYVAPNLHSVGVY